MTESRPMYDSARRGSRTVEELADLFRFRDLLFALIGNSLKVRYKRSVIGIGWTLLNPLVTMLVMSIAFSRLFREDVSAYPVYVLSGVLLWNFFSQATLTAMHRLVYDGGNLLTRIYLPRSIFSVAAVGTGLVNLLLGLIPLALVAAAYGVRPTAALCFVPVSLAVALMFVLGVALALATVAVFYTDVIEIYQAAVLALFYVTPVLYPARIIPERFSWLIFLNPMTHLLDLFRAPILLGRLPSTQTLTLSLLWSVLALAVGFRFFTAKADEFVYRT